jgi:predicted ribosome quality control (RQC) complex YloA/Tae2 family protein
LGIIRKKCQKLERRAAAVEQDLRRLDDVPRLQKIGALLLAQGKTIARGTTRVQLFDWSTNENLEVELSPDKPVKDQAQDFFQKARRLQRGADVMQKRIADTHLAMHSLQAVEKALHDTPEDWDALQEFAQHMQSLGLSGLSIQEVSSAKRPVPDERKPYHCFYSKSGAVIWVGRNSRDNDELVTRLAKPHDLWLHAKNIRGAHVVIPLEKNRSCPADLLVDAATLAAHFSDARNESICEVSYVERRYVRKPKKSLPGAVTTLREKVIVVRIEKDRLTKLLSSKVET